MKLVYIAGPLDAPTAWEREQNIRNAEAVQVALLRMGANVYCPHTQDRFLHGVLPEDEFLHRDLQIIRRCDAVVMLPRSEKSQGAKVERRFAEKVGLRVFAWPAEFYGIQQWIQSDEHLRCMGCGKCLGLRPQTQGEKN